MGDFSERKDAVMPNALFFVDSRIKSSSSLVSFFSTCFCDLPEFSCAPLAVSGFCYALTIACYGFGSGAGTPEEAAAYLDLGLVPPQTFLSTQFIRRLNLPCFFFPPLLLPLRFKSLLVSRLTG